MEYNVVEIPAANLYWKAMKSFVSSLIGWAVRTPI